jgi:hypothetical protein
MFKRRSLAKIGKKVQWHIRRDRWISEQSPAPARSGYRRQLCAAMGAPDVVMARCALDGLRRTASGQTADSLLSNGHYPETPDPGTPSNVALAGHAAQIRLTS